MLKIGHIFAGIRERLAGERDVVKLIPGGPAAPELACRPRDYAGELPAGDWQAHVKIDGIRCLYIDDRLVTLEGQPFNAARHCLEDLRALQRFYGRPMFFDGEYVEEAGFEATLSAYRKGEGTGTIWLFDAVPLDEWLVARCEETWRTRHARLMLNNRSANLPWVGALEAFPVKDAAEVKALADHVQGHGHEGLVLKRGDSLYSRDRSPDWLKVKPIDTTDMRLIDVLGNEKRGATKLICQDRSGPVILTTGFASARQLIWTNRELFLGDGENQPGVLVEVKHNGRTLAGKPRHAVFSKLRHDRMPADEEAL
jgi:ATP-dependent DNA ligase